jgi:hypothetical protein
LDQIEKPYLMINPITDIKEQKALLKEAEEKDAKFEILSNRKPPAWHYNEWK